MVQLFGMLKKIFLVFILLICFIFSVTITSSHGTEASLEKEVGKYIVDIGYKPEEIKEKETEVFDFNLIDKTSKEEIVFTKVWVRISNNNESAFAGGLAKSSLAKTTLSLQFPESGEYEFSVRFQNEEETLAEASFPISVEKTEPIKKTSESPKLVLSAIAGALLASAIVYIITTRRIKPTNTK